jgi:hypothetical protein
MITHRDRCRGGALRSDIAVVERRIPRQSVANAAAGHQSILKVYEVSTLIRRLDNLHWGKRLRSCEALLSKA